MTPTFIDKSLQETFHRLGYVILPFPKPFNTDEIKAHLIQLQPSDNYQGHQDTKIGKQSFHVTFFDKNSEYKQHLFSFVNQLFSEFAKNTFTNHKCCQANVFLKQPGVGYVYPHQNLTIVDENEFTSVSCWMPLQDTNFNNGTVCLIPGSQHYFQKYRNTSIYWPYIDFFRNGEGVNYFKPIDVKAGEILILDDRLVHYTPENKSTAARWVLHALFAPRDAQLKFFDVQVNRVDEYHVADDFWQSVQPLDLPSALHLVKSFEFKDTHYTSEDLQELVDKLKAELA